MSGLLGEVDQRTHLVGQNRMELLLFRLSGRQRYGINVFKIQEVIQCPALTKIPHSNPVTRGVASMRGRTIPVIDLGKAIGFPPIEDLSKAFVIVAEYNRSVQGFLVSAVERIVNMNWEEIQPPPKGSGEDHYLAAVTKVDDTLIEIIDVEKVLTEVVRAPTEVSPNVIDTVEKGEIEACHVLVADDSSVARNQIKRTLDQLGVEYTFVNDGKQALDQLKKWVEDDDPVLKRLALIISDIEMPEMDGYTLASEIRRHPRIASLYVLLHTSLSGVFNHAMIEKVGADEFIPKFDPNDLGVAVVRRLENFVKAQRENAL